MSLVRIAALIAAAALVAPAAANDSMATLGAGGLLFVTTEDVAMVSEDLYISAEEVRVAYEFRNNGEADQTALVAFPLPDIKGDGDFMVAIPSEDPVNMFGFETWVNGEPAEVTTHQYAFATNIDYTEYLEDLGVPLLPFGQDTQAAIDALGDEDKQELLHRALVIPMSYDAGQGWQTDYVPAWTLKTTYSFEVEFPVGETVEVEHRYEPSAGGTVGVVFLAEPYEDYNPAAEYAKKYCTDESFVRAVERTLPNPAERYGAPFTETWLSYIWSTGRNWGGPIGTFHLTIDKGRAENLVSFCWDGEVTKTSPTTFEMEATDFWPPFDRELDVLILNRQ